MFAPAGRARLSASLTDPDTTSKKPVLREACVIPMDPSPAPLPLDDELVLESVASPAPSPPPRAPPPPPCPPPPLSPPPPQLPPPSQPPLLHHHIHFLIRTGAIPLPVVIVAAALVALWVLRCFVVLCVRCSRCCCSRRGTKVGEAALDESDTARLLNPPAARLSDHRVQTWGTHVISLDELALYLDRPAPPMRSASCCDYILCRCCEDDFESRVKTYPAGMPHRLLLGITIDGLRRWLLEQVGHAPYADLAESGYLAQQRADAACANDGLSVCERLGRGWGTSACVGQADVYVCWAISSPISSLLEALESFLDLPHRLEGARGPPRPRDRDKTFFWISTFSLRNHTPAPAPAPPSREHVLYLTSLGLIIESIGHMVVLVESWEAPLALSRAHCLHEVALSYERKVRIELVMGDSAKQKFAHAFAKDFDPMRQLLDRFSIVDLWQAQCAEARDAAFLREGAEVRGFAPAPEGSQEREAGRGRAAVNRQLRHVLRAALIRFARGTVARLSAAERPKSLSIDRLGTVRAYPTPPVLHLPARPPSLLPSLPSLPS